MQTNQEYCLKFIDGKTSSTLNQSYVYSECLSKLLRYYIGENWKVYIYRSIYLTLSAKRSGFISNQVQFKLILHQFIYLYEKQKTI